MAYFKKHWDPDLFSEVEEVVQMRVSLSIYFLFIFHLRACWGTEPYVALHNIII